MFRRRRTERKALRVARMLSELDGRRAVSRPVGARRDAAHVSLARP